MNECRPTADDADDARRVEMSTTPVSVVLYVHNGGEYLEPALQSICVQTHRAFELCVVDDGSTDATGAILDQLASADARVRVRHQPARGSDGLHETVNAGLAMSTHDLIAIANADDVWLPHKLAMQVAAFDADPALDICHHDATFIDHRGRVLHGGFRPVPSALPAPPPRPWQFVGGNPIANPTTMFHRSILRRIGLQEVGQMHDHQFWFKACVHGCRFVGLPDRLIRYRVHEGSESTASGRKERIAEQHRECAEMMVDRYGLDLLYPELHMVEDQAESRAWAWSHLGSLFWLREAFDAAEHAWETSLRSTENAATIGNLGGAALRRGERHRALPMLRHAAEKGDQRSARLLADPALIEHLAPETWHGTAPAIADLVAAFAGGELPLPSTVRLGPAHACLAVTGSAEPGAVQHRLTEAADGSTPAAGVELVVLATDRLAVDTVVEAHASLEQEAPDVAAALNIELVEVHPAELATVVRAHAMDGAAILDPVGEASALLTSCA